jgi:hypothetical protein
MVYSIILGLFFISLIGSWALVHGSATHSEVDYEEEIRILNEKTTVLKTYD